MNDNSEANEYEEGEEQTQEPQQAESNLLTKITHEAKLKELLRNITSNELKLCSDASKEFIRLLKSSAGPEILCEYTQTSSKCIELSEAWDHRKTKPGGLSCILKLISVILNQRVMCGSRTAKVLDKFARWIVEERIGDLCKELNSKEGKRQKAALLLLASVVRCGQGLAWEVAKRFDFKMATFGKLAEWKGRRRDGRKRAHLYTRKAFVGFAMSFLEVGNPRLLREILQQKGMYSGVLRGLGNDDEETVVYVLTTLRNKVLVPESLVPPGLRSVLFGSVTLEQLVRISGREDCGLAAEVGYNLLMMVSTDPCNGLMPDLDRHPSPLRGNPKRLLDHMKKLKATEVEYHKYLLLAIVKGRPSFGSAFLDMFPYNLDDLSLPNWFAAVSLAADVVSAVADGVTFNFLNSSSQEPLAIDNSDVQNVIRCIGARPFTRLIINKGLLHIDPLTKHATLKLVLEGLKLLDSFLGSLKSISSFDKRAKHGWESLKQDIENELRMSLPDPQVLLSLLSSLNSYYKSPDSCLKRPAGAVAAVEHTANSQKKIKTNNVNEDMDIVISGICSSPDITLHEDGEQSPDEHGVDKPNDVADIVKLIGEIWGIDQCSLLNMVQKDGDTFFYSKLLDAFKIYHRTMPNALEGSFDFFKVLPNNPLSLPDILQRSLLSLLVEHVGWSSRGETVTRMLAQMYKHLHPFINLLMYSPRRDIKNQAYLLARAAMLSTGAFDKNPREICAWFLFIPGYGREINFVEHHGIEIIQKLSSIIVSFLCDAVSTLGNNLFKYLDLLRRYVCDVQGAEGLCPDFSPFVICVLEKCIRLLSSEFGTFTLPEKTMISVYVCSTLKYLLETQAKAGLLSSVIDLLLSERFKCSPNIADMSGDFCEWRPMKILLLFARNILHQRPLALRSNIQGVVSSGGSLTDTLAEVKRVLRSEYDSNLVGIAIALSYSIICTKPRELLQSFPSAITISTNLYSGPLLVLSSIVYLEPDFLFSISKSWPKIFLSGGDMFMGGVRVEVRTKEVVDSMDFNSKESASAAFSFFLDMAPFHVLFPAILLLDGSLLFHNSKTVSLLLDKISGTTPDNILSALCHVLFWLNQAKVSYKIKPLDGLEEFSEKCIILAEHMLKQVLFLKVDGDPSSYKWSPFSTQYVQEVVEIIFCHPVVVTALECPLTGSEGYSDEIFVESLEKFLELAEQGIHKIDLHVLNLLRTACEQLLSFCESQKLSEVEQGTKEIAKVFKDLKRKLLLILKARFDGCLKSKNLVPLIPISFALHMMLRFISPFELLELVHWIFSKIDLTDTALPLSFRRSVLLAALHIAGCAFDLLSAYLHVPSSQKTLSSLFWEMEEKDIDVSLFEKIFFQVYEIASRFELDVADTCLLKALRVVKTHQAALQHCIPSIMVLSRVVASTPVNLLSRCMHSVTKTRSLLLLSLAELSSLHVSFFGYLFASMINKSSLFKADLTNGTCNYDLSEEELVMLLPTALLYLNSANARFGGLYYKNFDYIPSLYWRTLFHIFSDWNNYVSMHMFEIELNENLPVSLEQFLDLLSTSLLGKSVGMMHHCLALSGLVNMETRLNLFDSLCLGSSKTDDMLDCNLSQVGIYSLGQCLNVVNRVAAKIYLSRLLLFPEHANSGSTLSEDGDVKDVPPEVNSNALDSSRIRFLNILVHSWRLIVKKFPSDIDNPKETEGQKYSLFKFLEQFLRQNIFDLTAEMNDCLTKLPCLTFVEQLAKSALLHRFEDPGTLKMLQNIVTVLSEGKFPCISLLQLLLAHSGFAQTIRSANNSGSTSFGMIFTPAPSILRSLAIPRIHLNSLDSESNIFTFEHMKQLEVIKLLRVLLRTSAQQCDCGNGKGIEINLRELVLLLLSSYGATLSEIDMEIYNLISEIESIDKSCTESLGEMDYLWGIAASRVRKEREQENSESSSDLNNTEAVGELRKIQFRENFPVDPKMCTATILNFPCFRAVGEVSPDKLQRDSFEGHSAENEKMQTYDPVFILRFSIHCLSMSYLEPLEFASSGLLAIIIASLSSPHDDLRKLGYQALGRFKSELERTQKRKDVTRLRLLLSYLQNGIEQPWQRISSITAVFVAEATLVLLNSSDDYYSTISKFLMSSPSANMKSIPLFQNLFWSSTVKFDADRMWMLRLLYIGLNTNDDAHIYIRNSVFEVVLSFYMSPLSNNDSKELILQMLKKSAKLHKMARYLVEQCGLIPWLSSAISSYSGNQKQDKGRFPLTQLTVGLEVLSDIISSRNIVEWLQKSALEQIAEFSVHLHKFLVDRMELIKGQTSLVRLCLHILVSTLKISQKRKVYQPHFTLSTEGILRLCEAIDVCSSGRCSPTAELGLKAILMSTPTIEILHMDPEKLLKFVSWAISTAVQAKARKVVQTEESFNLFTVYSEVENSNDSIVSKLLRWLTASVILGRFSWRSNNSNFSSSLIKRNPLSLQTLLEWDERGPAEKPTDFGNEETLAASIFYLQQLLSINCKLLPSVVSALCLLLFTNSSSAGTEVSLGHANSLASLFSKISCPAEVNPLWRWSFYQPWKDLSSQPTEVAKVEEMHACQILLVEISNILGTKSSYSQFLSLNDVMNSPIFEWETSILKSQ